MHYTILDPDHEPAGNGKQSHFWDFGGFRCLYDRCCPFFYFVLLPFRRFTHLRLQLLQMLQSRIQGSAVYSPEDHVKI